MKFLHSQYSVVPIIIMSEKVLIVDDEESILKGIKLNLGRGNLTSPSPTAQKKPSSWYVMKDLLPWLFLTCECQ